MGRLSTEGTIEAGDEFGLPRRQQLLWHLSCNHYPPVHADFVVAAEEAIRLADEGRWEAEVTLPNGLVRTAAFVIEGLHLEPFLNGEEI
jgi:hypothetical protein